MSSNRKAKNAAKHTNWTQEMEQLKVDDMTDCPRHVNVRLNKEVYQENMKRLEGKEPTKTYMVPFTQRQGGRTNPIKGVEMIMGTTQEAAEMYYTRDKVAPVILSFASNRFVCGGVVNGADGQEEQLARCIPELPKSLLQFEKDYPFGGTTVLVTPNVTIDRHHETYELLKEPIPVHVVSASAPDLRHLELSPSEYQLRVQETLINVIVTSRRYCPDAKRLVLGGFGCGAYKNDPYKMAQLMCGVAADYGGHFETIAFTMPYTTSYWDLWCDRVYKTFKNLSPPPSFTFLDEGPKSDNDEGDEGKGEDELSEKKEL